MTTPALYSEDAGSGIPILLIHPAGSTASTWGPVVDDLAQFGRVIAYDRRGYARSGGAPPRSLARHTADAAAVLDDREAESAVVVGTSAGAAIAVDLAARRPDRVRAVVAHEFPWRFVRQRPSRSQAVALAKIAALVVQRRERDAAETLLRSAYAYRDGGSAWDAFPAAWREAARDNARATLVDFSNSIRNYPVASQLGAIRVPVVCSYGSRSPDGMRRLVQKLAAAIPSARTRCLAGAGHAAPFDAAGGFAALVSEVVSAR